MPVRRSSAACARARRARSGRPRPSACRSRGGRRSAPPRRGSRATRAELSEQRSRRARSGSQARLGLVEHQLERLLARSARSGRARVERARDRVGLGERLPDEREARRQADPVARAQMRWRSASASPVRIPGERAPVVARQLAAQLVDEARLVGVERRQRERRARGRRRPRRGSARPRAGAARASCACRRRAARAGRSRAARAGRPRSAGRSRGAGRRGRRRRA